MSLEEERQTVELLREIRDSQTEILKAMEVRRALALEQLQYSRSASDVQRAAFARLRIQGWVAGVAILFCIAAIGYLVLRYL